MRDFTGWEEVEEDLVKHGLELSKGNQTVDTEAYKRVLAMVELYKQAELTPIIMYDSNSDRMTVTAEEFRNPYLIN